MKTVNIVLLYTRNNYADNFIDDDGKISHCSWKYSNYRFVKQTTKGVDLHVVQKPTDDFKLDDMAFNPFLKPYLWRKRRIGEKNKVDLHPYTVKIIKNNLNYLEIEFIMDYLNSLDKIPFGKVITINIKN